MIIKQKEPVLNNGGDYRVISSEKGTKNIAGIQVEGYNLLIENLLNNKQTPFKAFIVSKNTPKEVIEALGERYEAMRLQALALPRGSKEARNSWIALSSFKDSFMTPVDITYKGSTKIGKTLDYGYAHTIHKSQGGTYKYSFVLDNTIDSFPDKELRSQLRYVAVTRAEEGTFVLTNKPISEKKVETQNEEDSEGIGNVSEEDVVNLSPRENIKPGVSELFESNPELANSVYEALGFKTLSENEVTIEKNRKR